MRLTRGPEMEACWRESRRIRTTHLDIAWRTNRYARPRAAIIVPRYQFTAVARNRIRRRLREFMTNPAVTVVVREVNSLKVFVLGEVVRPGPVVLRSRTSLLQAIAQAGGVTPFGGRDGVIIYRQGSGTDRVLEVSYRDLVTGRRPEGNVPLEPGDTVLVR